MIFNGKLKMIPLGHYLSRLMRETQASIYCIFFIY